MSGTPGTLLCWHADRAGVDVLVHALKSFRKRKVPIGQVIYLLQPESRFESAEEVEGVPLTPVELQVEDPTKHIQIYNLVREQVLPRLTRLEGVLHLNISPGTPAMHSVWLILHAGGAFPSGTHLWSSQRNPKTGRTWIDPVDFPVSTYLSAIRAEDRLAPLLAKYEPDARSKSRRDSLERLARYARVRGAPLLLMGERGTGKTRLVETFVSQLKERENVVTVACGGLDSSLAESLLFGHTKGAFTNAMKDRSGLLAEADGGMLFLDEVQDLPRQAQRQLVRVLQDRQRRYRPLGGDKEVSADFDLVCASNLSMEALQKSLDADFFDRISQLIVAVPPLRDCREDIQEDWQHVWKELRLELDLPEEAPWGTQLDGVLKRSELGGNLRDLQKLALLLMAWWGDGETRAMEAAINEWKTWQDGQLETRHNHFGAGTRAERVRKFQGELAAWAKERCGTWASAAEFLKCDEKTLRADYKRVNEKKPDRR